MCLVLAELYGTCLGRLVLELRSSWLTVLESLVSGFGPRTVPTYKAADATFGRLNVLAIFSWSLLAYATDYNGVNPSLINPQAFVVKLERS